MLNLVCHLLYLLISTAFTIRLGNVCYRSGELYLAFFVTEASLAERINKLLLTGFYLVNLGFVVWFLSVNEPIKDVVGLISFIATKIGIVLISLALLHLNNLFVIHKIFKKQLN